MKQADENKPNTPNCWIGQSHTNTRASTFGEIHLGASFWKSKRLKMHRLQNKMRASLLSFLDLWGWFIHSRVINTEVKINFRSNLVLIQHSCHTERRLQCHAASWLKLQEQNRTEPLASHLPCAAPCEQHFKKFLKDLRNTAFIVLWILQHSRTACLVFKPRKGRHTAEWQGNFFHASTCNYFHSTFAIFLKLRNGTVPITKRSRVQFYTNYSCNQSRHDSCLQQEKLLPTPLPTLTTPTVPASLESTTIWHLTNAKAKVFAWRSTSHSEVWCFAWRD